MTLSVVVDETGISAPTYADILSSLQDSMRSIFGADLYLEADSQDGQFLGILALAIKDINDSAIAVYNDFSPSTAVGAGLSSVVKVNGIKRQIPTNSSAVVTIVGQAGTTIPAGSQVGDSINLGSVWFTLTDAVIPLSGTLDVTVFSAVSGAIRADTGTITNILTPIPGWQTANNTAPAIVGAPVENDATLRRRQTKSTSLPAQTPLEGIYGVVANLTGVTRAATYQNDTNATDSNNLPAHNIAVVVAGGDAAAIAQAIALKKPPGTPTYGTVPTIVFDNNGVPNTILYSPLVSVSASVLVFVTALAGYVDSTTVMIQQSLVNHITGLNIGETSYLSRLHSPANLTGDAAISGTGLSQLQLDPIADTYHITSIAQNRFDTVVTGGPYVAGVTTINVTDVKETIAVGDIVYWLLNDLSYLRTVVTGVTGTGTVAVTFLPAIPSSKTVSAGTIVHVADDLLAAFDEAFTTVIAQIVVTVTT